MSHLVCADRIRAAAARSTSSSVVKRPTLSRTAPRPIFEDTPIAWVDRDQRYGEKLATPDITIADLIGEVDPIRVAEGRYLGDELTIQIDMTSADAEPINERVCHCRLCQKAIGAAFNARLLFRIDDVTVEGPVATVNSSPAFNFPSITRWPLMRTPLVLPKSRTTR